MTSLGTEMRHELVDASPAENSFSIWSPQIASDDSKFFSCVVKSGGTGSITSVIERLIG